MLVMQEDPDGEHQENVLATGMVANSRPRDQPAKIAHRWNYQPIRGRQSAVWVCGRDTHRHVLRIEGKMLDGIADNERIRLAALLASCVANLSKATGKVLRMPALPANVRYRQ